MLLSSVLVILFTGCDKNSNLKKELSSMEFKGNVITDEQMELLGQISLEKDKNPELMTSEKGIDQTKLLETIIKITRNKKLKRDVPKILTAPSSLKIFFENSGSMDGYVNGLTDFKAALLELVIQTEHIYGQRPELNLIANSEFFSLPYHKPDDIVPLLDPKSNLYKKGNRNESELNLVIRTALEKTDGNTLSFLISDFTYSIGKERDVLAGLNFQKSLTKGAFLETLRDKNIATGIMQLTSDFTGIYYTKSNIQKKLNKFARPIYIMVVGKKELVFDFFSKINMKRIKNYENLVLFYSGWNSSVPFSILRETEKMGGFMQARSKEGINSPIHEIKKIKFTQKEGILQFSLAVNLKGLPVESSYIENSANYSLTRGVEIVSIKRILPEKINKRDLPLLNEIEGTHLITLSINKDSIVDSIQLSLLKGSPSWIEKCSNIDDEAGPDNTTTFGFAYLIRGIEEAYVDFDQNSDKYFSINIKISER